jgi:ferredoxin-NADP reductase
MNYQCVKFEYAQKELGDIWSFYFSKPSEFVFVPGQYVFFAISDPDSQDFDAKKDRHCLSLSNSLESEYLRVTVDVSSGSYFKTFLMNLKQLDEVYITNGMGIFTLDNPKLRPFSSNSNYEGILYMIAGGVGITPFVSIVTSQDNDRLLQHSTLIHVSNDENIFENELKDISLTQVRTTFENVVVDYSDVHRYMIAGSPGFVESIKTRIVEAGVDSQNIILDIFLGY